MSVIEIQTKKNSCGRILLLKCDICLCEFIKKFQTVQLQKNYHFCSINCVNLAKKNGKILQTEFKQKHGVSNNFAKKEVIKKIRDKMLEKYNVENCSQINEVKIKKKCTFQKHYGLDHPMKNPKEVIRRQDLCEINYGKRNGFAIAHTRGTAILSFNDPKIRDKALNSRIKSNLIFISKLEKLFIERLEILLQVPIIKQYKVHKWPIDCYVPFYDLFIQFDGDHHHGIQERSKIYKSVQLQMKRDLEQNEWFLVNNLNLLRISSSIAKKISNKELFKIVLAHKNVVCLYENNIVIKR
jgi:hypothetical protein